MTNDQRKEMYERTMSMLRPVFERIVSDPDFRQRLELKPLAALTEVGVALDAATRKEFGRQAILRILGRSPQIG